MSWYYYEPYVTVAERKEKAEKKIKSLRKQGKKISPVIIVGRKITTTVWGNAWCKHLESLGDYENRLPRGRSYVRNGFVIDLKVNKGIVEALVHGSSLYKVNITITTLSKERREKLMAASRGKVASLVELLQGKLSAAVMGVITEELLPLSSEISFKCSCPDYACMCKHVAAVLYGIGARLDHVPEELFVLRHMDQRDLIGETKDIVAAVKAKTGATDKNEDSLLDLFDIEIDNEQKSMPVKPKTSALQRIKPKARKLKIRTTKLKTELVKKKKKK